MAQRKEPLLVAVEALVLLAAAPEGQMSSGALADRIGSHAVTLRRMLALLRTAGLVEGRAGHDGGWAIARDPAKLSVGDVYRALHARAIPPATSLDRALDEADAAYVARLDRLTIGKLVAEGYAAEPHL